MSKQNVLVVDDEATIRRSLKRMLESDEIEVSTACDGEEALDQFEKTNPDLVLLDLMMPKLNGFEVCRRLKSDPGCRLTPVVMLTSSTALENRVRCIEAGADDFLTKPFERVELTARVRSLLRLKTYTDELEQSETVLFALARAIEGKDPSTQGHCERLSVYSEKLGRRLGLAEEEVKALRRAGVVHDVGKVAVPDAILLKNGRLTEEEMAVMKQHPVVGYEICKCLKSFRLVLPVIRHHHEKLDGTGYPDGLRHEEIPLTARVLQVVDVYDALTTERPYKPAFSMEMTLQIMQEEVDKGWWDASIFESWAALVQDQGFTVSETVPDEDPVAVAVPDVSSAAT